MERRIASTEKRSSAVRRFLTLANKRVGRLKQQNRRERDAAGDREERDDFPTEPRAADRKNDADFEKVTKNRRDHNQLPAVLHRRRVGRRQPRDRKRDGVHLDET